MLWAHLFALAIAYFRVGYRVESHLHCIFGAPLRLTAFMSSAGNPDQVRFDSDSFLVHVDNHASYCMANLLDLKVSTYLLVGSIPAKATKHLKSPLVTRYLTGNRNWKREGLGI